MQVGQATKARIWNMDATKEPYSQPHDTMAFIAGFECECAWVNTGEYKRNRHEEMRRVLRLTRRSISMVAPYGFYLMEFLFHEQYFCFERLLDKGEFIVRSTTFTLF